MSSVLLLRIKVQEKISDRRPARSEDLVPAASALAAAACHSTTPCGSTYGSCASWSPYSTCGDVFCSQVQHGCGFNCEPGFPCWGPGLAQSSERYRVCFSASGQQCTEYQRTWITVECGC